MKTLWVDDIRNPYEYAGFNYNVLWATTFHEAMNALNHNDFEEIYLDNDLGDPNDYQGKDVLYRIEEILYFGGLKNLKRIFIHSSNTPAVNSMLSCKNNMLENYSIVVERLMFDIKK